MRSSLLLLPGLLTCVAAGCGDTAPAAGGTPMVIQVISTPWDAGPTSGRELVSPHYRIYTTSASPEILNCLPGFLEAGFENYLAVTGLAPHEHPEPMPVYMMATRQEWAALTKSIVGGQWETYAAIQAGGYCYKGVCVFWDMGGVASLSVASHEGLHQFLRHRLTDRLPMWLEEGLATMTEGYQIDGQAVRFTPEQNLSRFADLRKALVNDWWIPLRELLPMDGGDAVKLWPPGRTVGYYGQVWALGLLLRADPALAKRRATMLADAEAGRFSRAMGVPAGRLQLLQRAGRSYNRAVAVPLFRHYIDSDLEAFERRYKAFARELAKL